MKFFLASRFKRGILRLSPRTKRYTDMTITNKFESEMDNVSRNAFSRLAYCVKREKETSGKMKKLFTEYIAFLKKSLGEWERGDYAGKKVCGK